MIGDARHSTEGIGRPLACITCGPASEPIDHVRRITNFSTGEIGVHLARALAAGGFEVVCFRGAGATYPPPAGCDVRPFTTNASLAEALQNLGRPPAAVFHAAALSDFAVAGIEGAEGSRKLGSRGGDVRILLTPAEKVLPRMRGWFPDARIAGWKYELDGTREDAVARGAAQVAEARTDACVVNGAAFGEGFGFLLPDGQLTVYPDKAALAAHLAGWAGAAIPR